MLPRSVLTGLVLTLALSGCATVSVVPGTSTVETVLTQKQSSLRDAASAFNEVAVTRGWISQTRGFLDLARVLVDGQTEAQADTTTYASFIGADIRSASDITATLTTDASDAADALAAVSVEADLFLTGRSAEDVTTARADLVSFERALVQAQQTRRAFIEAIKVADLDQKPNQTLDMQNALTRFDGEIDRARALADRLATEYANRDTNGAIS